MYSGAGHAGQAVELCLRTNRIPELVSLLNEMLSGVSHARGTHTSDELLIKAGNLLVSLNEGDYALDDYNSYVKMGLLALAHAKAID